MTTLYGLSNCDTCKKARKWLDRFGVAHAFVDYRDQRPPPETLVAWKDAVGGWDALVALQIAAAEAGALQVGAGEGVALTLGALPYALLEDL